MAPRYHVPSVDTAARVLGRLSRYRTRSQTLSELSVGLDVSKATCLRVLKTLESHGLLEFDERTKRYSLGYQCVVLGARAEEGLDLLASVRPLLAEASERTSLTAAFVQRIADDRMMYVAKAEGDGAAGVTVSIGNRFPITEVSYGRWVVAFADPADRAALLSGGLRQVTPNTVTDVEEYLRGAEQARHDGTLLSRSEYVPGITAVSCPVVGVGGDLAGVLTVLGVSEAITGEELDSVRAHMREIAARARFDGRGPTETEEAS